jgi:hypothetical protein
MCTESFNRLKKRLITSEDYPMLMRSTLVSEGFKGEPRENKGAVIFDTQKGGYGGTILPTRVQRIHEKHLSSLDLGLSPIGTQRRSKMLFKNY